MIEYYLCLESDGKIMELKPRDYVFISLISIFPFLLILLSFKFYFQSKFILNNTIFWILISVLGVIFIVSFIICLFYTLDHIIYKQKILWKKIIHFMMLFFFNIIYIPFYYGNYFIKEKLLGYFVPIINIIVLVFFSFACNSYILKYFEKLDKEKIVLNSNFTYLSNDGLFTIDVLEGYTCDKTLGDYVVACDNINDDSFLGVYSYNYQDYSLVQLDEVYLFHIEQTINYITDAGYSYEIMEDDDKVIFVYNENMCIIVKKSDYDINYDKVNDYRLVIIKEVSYHDNMIDDFNNLINSIRFVGE